MKRSVEVLNYKNVERFASYYVANKSALSELKNAIDSDDVDAMNRNIKNNFRYTFVDNLMVIYDSLIKELSKMIIQKYAGMLPAKQSIEATGRKYQQAVKPISKDKIKVKVQYKKIMQKTKKGGKSYSRTKPSSYTKREEEFLANNIYMTNVELVRTYNKFFNKRTKSSLISKKYRLIRG